MGFNTSGTANFATSGMNQGGETAPAVRPNVKLPKLTPTKTYKIPVPRDCVAGDEFRAELDGVDTILKVPDDFTHVRGTRIIHTVRGDDDQIIASTLPTVPGYEIVLAKPIVYGCVMAPAMPVGELVQQAQDQLTSQAMANNCNAVLGMHFSITTDGKEKTPVVAAFGTPCVVLPSASLPQLSKASASRASATAKTVDTSDEEEEEEPVPVVAKKASKKTVVESEDESEEDEDMGIMM